MAVTGCLLCMCSASAQDHSEGGVYIRQAAASVQTESEEITDDDVTRDEALDLILNRLSPADRPTLEAFLTTTTAGHFFLGEQHGTGNTALVEQYGDANLAVVLQNGTGNRTTAIQNGSLNVFGAWFTGDENQLHVEQYGNENIYLLDFTGSGLNPPPVIQQGDMNQAFQIGVISSPFGIAQRGNGMRMVIEHKSTNQ